MPRTPHRSVSRRLLDVYDFLHAPHRRYLSREYDVMMKAREAFWHSGRAPYPLDADTAAIVEGIASSYVVCWAVVDRSVEEWVYERLKSEAAEEATALAAPLQPEALPPLPDLEALRAYREGRDWCGEEIWYHG